MINEIKIKDYRSIKILNSQLKKVNTIIKPNGIGKTNILEAIYFAVFGNTFRNINSSEELIRIGCEFTNVVLSSDINTLTLSITKTSSRINKITKLNSKNVDSFKRIQSFPIILFAPHSVDLISGEPLKRRTDLDNFLSTCFPLYSTSIIKYQKILKNRNLLLKNIQSGKSEKKELHFWTEQLIEISDIIFKERVSFFENIVTFITQTASELYHDFKSLVPVYTPNIITTVGNFKDFLSQKFIDNQNKEIIVGRTLYGIHKDDYEFQLNSQNVRYFSSRGQQRLSSFIIKLAQHKYLKELLGYDVTFLIDDIFSELDFTHKENIASYIIKNIPQSIITSPNVEDIPKSIIEVQNEINLTL